MSFILENLVINRVDLVDEGANSAAFIELYKRKEQSDKMELQEIIAKMKPEHAAIVEAAIAKAAEDLKVAEDAKTVAEEAATKAMEDLKTSNESLEGTKTELETLKATMPMECDGTDDGECDDNGMCKVCGKPRKKAKAGAAFDEAETMKSMPKEAREMFAKMKAQKEAAEEEVRKAKEAEKTAEAVAKAADLKNLPIEHDKLVGLLKSASPDVVDLLGVVNAAINGTVLGEVGKSQQSGGGADAWTKIEAKAADIEKRDTVTKAKAITIAVRENPDLYKEYLQGGAN